MIPTAKLVLLGTLTGLVLHIDTYGSIDYKKNANKTGESSIGRSSILPKYGTNTFEEGKEITIGAAYMARVCSTKGSDIKLEIWDTAGQERFQSLTPMYYRNALAAIVVYDLTNATIFERAIQWVYELRQKGHPKVLITLVGNKADLLDHAERAISLDGVESLVEQFSIFQYIETSAFYGTGIVQLITEIVKIIPFENIKCFANIPNLDDDSKPDTHCTC